MELYFLRHGIAADEGPAGMGDAGRPLTKDGIAKMQAGARGMRRLGLRLDVLLSSPLVRARETAAIIARELGLELQLADELAPGCDIAQLFALLGEHRAADSADQLCLHQLAVRVADHLRDFDDRLNLRALGQTSWCGVPREGRGRNDRGDHDAQ